MQFQEKIVLLTGASGGIGKAIAESFAAEGARLALVGRNSLRTEETASATGAEYFSTIDITKPENCRELVRDVAFRLGSVDVLVNNAGGIARGNTAEVTEKEWFELFDINVHAPFFLSQEAIRIMQNQQNKGVIVNISSVLGLRGKKEHIIYCTTKGALIQMTRSMALDCAEQGIRINAVCPGTTDTPMPLSKHKAPMTHELLLENSVRMIPLKRPADPVEIAKTVLFLASDSASYITGTTLSVDGGVSAG